MNEPMGRFGSCNPARRDRLGLPDDAAADLLLHLQQLVALALQHPLDRHAGPPRDDLRDIVGRHRFVDQIGVGARFRLGELLLQIGNDAVGQLAGFGVISLTLRLGERGAGGLQVFLDLLRSADLVLLGAPAGGHRVGLLLQFAEFRRKLHQPVTRGGVGLLAERLLLDL
jgi:hypothetical protein